MTPEAEFRALLRQLEDWYADSTRAVTYDGPGHGASEPGHRILRVQPYPGPDWRDIWREATDSSNAAAQQAIIRALADELFGLDHGPSQSGPASGLHRGTREWALAVARADGSLRAVGRRFGISHTEVRRLRAAHPAERQEAQATATTEATA